MFRACRYAAPVLAFFAAALGVAFSAPAYGTVYVSTLPTGANVWIDGTYVGRSPVLVDPVARGHHAVTLTKTGWIVQEADVDVSAGATSMVSYRLRIDAHKGGGAHAQGTVALRGVLPQARVTIDGERVTEPSEPLALSAGTHVAVVSTGGAKISRTFTVYSDTTTDVLVSDPPAEDHLGGIVAPAEEYLPDHTYSVAGKRVVVRYGGHQVIGTIGETTMRLDGATVSYDAVPSRIKGKLYLPLALLTKLTTARAK